MFFFFFRKFDTKVQPLFKILPSLARFIFEDYLDISSKLNINFNDKR